MQKSNNTYNSLAAVAIAFRLRSTGNDTNPEKHGGHNREWVYSEKAQILAFLFIAEATCLCSRLVKPYNFS